jgi:4-azaleucine resistance transporter AzlC
MSSPRSEFFAGARAEIPILLGVIPFGIIFGALAVEAGLPALIAFSTSSLIFAGSAQFIAAQLFREAAPGLIVVLTVFVVNLRHMLYSASIAPHVAHLSQRWKWLLAYLLTDEAYAVIIVRYHDERDSTHKHWYALGAGLALWGTWQASTALGILLRAQAGDRLLGLGLDFAIAVTFIALVVPGLKDRAVVAAALSSGLAALAAASLPYNLGLMIAAVAGISAGVVVERIGVERPRVERTRP